MPSPAISRRHQLTEALAWIARGLVVGLLLIAPWPYAMAEWSSQIWLVPAVGAILLLASLVAISRRFSVGNPLVWGLSAVLAIGLLQVVPLPESLWKLLALATRFEQQVEQLSHTFAGTGLQAPPLDDSNSAISAPPPNASKPNDSADTAPPSTSQTESGPTSANNPERITASLEPSANQTLSIDPLQTRATICVLAMGLALLVSSIILFRDRLSVAILLGSLSVSGLAIALLGIFQAVAAGDWTFIDVPKQTSFATFYSRNSAPQFLACCFAATGGLLALYVANKSKRQQDKRYQLVYPSVNIAARLRRRIEEFVSDADPISFVLLLVMVLQFAGVLIANSRGGILAFFASGLIVVLIYALGRQASFSAIVAVIFLVVGSGLFLSLYGLDELVGARLDTVSREAYQMDNVRLKLWGMAFSQPSCWLLGSGLGTFHFALLPLYDTPQSTWFYHAENVYVELASGAGVVTLLIALAGLLWLIGQLLSQPSLSNTGRSTRFACLFTVLAVGLHNLVDFSLILPAVFLPVACLVGAYLGTRHQVRQKVKRSRHSHSTSKKPTGNSGGSERHKPQSDDSESTMSLADDRERYAHRRKHQTPGGSERKLAATTSSSADAPSQATVVASHSAPAWAPQTLIVCLLLISSAVGMGYRPLSAFAFAEQLRSEQQPDSDLVELIKNASRSHWGTFPESRLQIGRWRQDLSRQQLQDSPRWPAEISAAMRQSLSHPEFFNTALHATQDPELQSLRDFLAEEPAVLANLSDSRADMLAALSACPLDWRASWGVLRSDVGDMPATERRRNYARILLTCRNNQPVLQAAGTHALMIGEVAAGMEIWRQLLPVSPRARSQVLNLAPRFLTVEQLVAILPDNPLQRIELARLALSRNQQPELSAAIVEATDLEQAAATAQYAADWPQVAWCAAQKGDLERELDAWEQAILDDAYNPQLVYSLVLTLQRAGRLQEALSRTNEALARFQDHERFRPQFQALKQALTAELAL